MIICILADARSYHTQRWVDYFVVQGHPTYLLSVRSGLKTKAEEFILNPGEKILVPTGLKIAVPNGFFGSIRDRSGLAANHGLHTLSGVIDSNYRGEIKIVIVNLGKEAFKIEKGMRIAQLLIQPVEETEFIEVNELDETERGDKGFNSSGTK